MRTDESQGSLNTYLKEISATPLLTREEEVILAGRIKAGDKDAKYQKPLEVAAPQIRPAYIYTRTMLSATARRPTAGRAA